MGGFGDRLREFRNAKGMSLDDLASSTGISRAYLWKLERKPDANPSLDRLQKLAKALDTTVGDLTVVQEQDTPSIPPSLRACQEEYGLNERDLVDLARIRFRGGHPTNSDDWYSLYLQLKRATTPPK